MEFIYCFRGVKCITQQKNQRNAQKVIYDISRHLVTQFTNSDQQFECVTLLFYTVIRRYTKLIWAKQLKL